MQGHSQKFIQKYSRKSKSIAESIAKNKKSDPPSKVKSRLFQGFQPPLIKLLSRLELLTSSLPRMGSPAHLTP